MVGSVADDLGDYARNFADILIATDAATMRTAGKAVAALSVLNVGGGFPVKLMVSPGNRPR